MTSSITISPLFQELTLDNKANVITREVTIINNTQSPLEVEGQLGVLSTQDSDSPPKGVPEKLVSQLPFAQLSPTSFAIAPNASASVEVKFTLSDALQSGGNYVAAVFSFKDQSGATSQVIPAVSSVFFATKKGSDSYQLSLQTIRTPRVQFGYPQELSLAVKNTGNTHVIPAGKISLLRKETQLARGIINQDSSYLFPGQTRSFTIDVGKLGSSWPIEYVELRVELNPHQQLATTQHTHIVLIQPSGVLLMSVVVFAILYSVVKMYVLKRPRSRRPRSQKNEFR